MKHILFLIVFFFSYAFLPAGQAGLNAQNSAASQEVHAPNIGLKLMLGDMADLGETQIKFKEVLTDSRCPKDVQCVWAGEAKVLIEVFENGSFIEEQELTFGGLSKSLEIINTEVLGVEALKLQPYPDTSIIKGQKNYYLVLGVREN